MHGGVVFVLRLRSGVMATQNVLHRLPSHATEPEFHLAAFCASEHMRSPETPWKDSPPTRGRPVRRVWPRSAVLSSTVAPVVPSSPQIGDV